MSMGNRQSSHVVRAIDGQHADRPTHRPSHPRPPLPRQVRLPDRYLEPRL